MTTTTSSETTTEVFTVTEAEVRGLQRAINARGGVVVQSSPVARGYQFVVRWPA